MKIMRIAIAVAIASAGANFAWGMSKECIANPLAKGCEECGREGACPSSPKKNSAGPPSKGTIKPVPPKTGGTSKHQ
jgi:hypothetical protein